LCFFLNPEQRDWEFSKILSNVIKVFRKFSADRANIFANSQTVIGDFPEKVRGYVETAFNLCGEGGRPDQYVRSAGPINFGNDRFDRFFANRQVGVTFFFKIGAVDGFRFGIIPLQPEIFP